MSTHTINVVPIGLQFPCDEDTSLLEAAAAAGYLLPYGCRKGNCGTCKAQVVDGEVDLDTPSTYSLSEFEQHQGTTLLCSAYPLSDLVVEIDELEVREASELTAAREIEGTIAEVDELTHDIRSLQIALDEPLAFAAGQFTQLNVPGTEEWRSYSMANAPSDPLAARFMIKIVPGGAFSTFLDNASAGQRVRLNGPHGTFSIRDHARPLLLVGGGAGMAPLWSMLQDLAERGDQRPIRFYYGARCTRDLFNLGPLEDLGGKFPDFELVTALSDVDGGVADAHRRGLIPDVLHSELADTIGAYDAYLCGPPPMIDATLAILARHGLQERKSIFFDKFTAS